MLFCVCIGTDHSPHNQVANFSNYPCNCHNHHMDLNVQCIYPTIGCPSKQLFYAILCNFMAQLKVASTYRLSGVCIFHTSSPSLCPFPPPPTFPLPHTHTYTHCFMIDCCRRFFLCVDTYFIALVSCIVCIVTNKILYVL